MTGSLCEIWFRDVFQTLSSKLVPLAGYEDRLRRIYAVGCREAGPVEREAGSSPRIDEQQRLFERYVAERLDEWHFDFATRNRNLQLVAALIAELHKIIGADIRDQVAERTIQGDYFSGQPFFIHSGGFQIEANQFFDYGADLGPVVAARDVSAYGREDIPAMESGGNFGADHPIRIGDLANAFDAVAVLDHGHQAVVGQHEKLPTL